MRKRKEKKKKEKKRGTALDINPLMSVHLTEKADPRNAIQIVRTDSPFELGSFNHSDVQRFAVTGAEETLLIATINPARSNSLISSLKSNTTSSILRESK